MMTWKIIISHSMFGSQSTENTSIDRMRRGKEILYSYLVLYSFYFFFILYFILYIRSFSSSLFFFTPLKMNLLDRLLLKKSVVQTNNNYWTERERERLLLNKKPVEGNSFFTGRRKWWSLKSQRMLRNWRRRKKNKKRISRSRSHTVRRDEDRVTSSREKDEHEIIALSFCIAYSQVLKERKMSCVFFPFFESKEW